jgi:hypothetical protein
MKNFDEYEVVFRATVAIPKGEKLELATLLENLTRRLETAGHEKFLVGHSHIHAIHENDSEA